MPHTTKCLFLLAAICVPPLSPVLSAERVLLDGMAAKVNNETIAIGDVLINVQPLVRGLSIQYGGEALREKMREAYREELNALIDRRLILDAYEKQEGRIPEWAVDQRVSEVLHERFGGDRDALMGALAKDQRTYDAWREEIRGQLIVASMQQSVVQKRVRVSADDVAAAYRRDPVAYRAPLEVKLSMMAWKKPADGQAEAELREKAGDLRRQLLEGADFAEFARRHSQGARAAEGGDWGWMETDDLRTELRQAVESLAPGAIGEVVETKEEIYLPKVEDRRGGEVQPFESAREEIERRLKRAEAERIHQEWVADLRKDAYIMIFDVNPFAADR